MIQANEWNSTAPQCITYNGGTGWTVSTANFNLSGGAPATYPSIYKGCHWGLCTGNSGLPIQMSKLGSAVSSWSTTQPSSGAYDVSYDIWFNSTPTTTGQPDGTEVMIWINSRGGVQPFGSQTGTANVDGMNWNVWTGQQTSWKIISYVLNPGATSVSNLDLKALFEDAVARGSINPANYLIDVEAGFEIWQGGQGLGTDSFSVTATANSGGGDTTPPSVPANLAVTGVTSSSRLAVLVAVHGQRRRGRIPGVPQRRPGRYDRRDHVHRHRAVRLDAVHVHGRRLRRGGQRLRPVLRRDRHDLIRGRRRQRMVASYAVTNQWSTGFTAERDGGEQRHRAQQGLEGGLDLGRQPADRQPLERCGEPQWAERDRHERELQRLHHCRRQHVVRLPGELLRLQHVPDAQLHDELTD